MEVMSPDDTSRDGRQGRRIPFRRRVSRRSRDPDALIVNVHRPGGFPYVLRHGEELDLSDVIPGFRCAVDDIFN